MSLVLRWRGTRIFGFSGWWTQQHVNNVCVPEILITEKLLFLKYTMVEKRSTVFEQ